MFHVLPKVGPVYSVSIIPTGLGAAGYTMPLPEKDEMFNTKGRMLQDIIVSLGGRVAEEIIFDDITTGASSDIKKATATARDMVVKYGFSELVGPINYDNDDDEVFIGRDLARARGYGVIRQLKSMMKLSVSLMSVIGRLQILLESMRMYCIHVQHLLRERENRSNGV